MSYIGDDEAEELVVGCCLINAKARDRVAETGLAPEHFFARPLKRIFAAIFELHAANEAVDTLSVARESGLPSQQVDALASYTIGDADSLRRHANRVMEMAMWRQRHIHACALAVACEAQDETAYARSEGELAIGPQKPDDVTFTPEQLADQLYSLMEGEGAEAFPWPFLRMDDLTSGGMRRGEVTLIGGWSSHGKSVLMDQCLGSAAANGQKVHLYINEMRPRERAARFVARTAEVLLPDLLRRQLNPAETKRVLAHIDKFPYSVTDASGWSAPQIARHMRTVKADVFGIDHLHLIEHADERDMAEISRVINVAAKQTASHVLAAVQLNEKRVVGATRPLCTLGDIRASGMLKNDADNVLFIFREQDADTGYPMHEAKAYFAKVRNGQTGGVALEFDGARMRFLEQESWRATA